MKTSKTYAAKLAIAAISSVIALSTITPALASVSSNYGVWSEAVVDDATGAFTGTITFAGTTVPGASYSTIFNSATEGNTVTVKDTSEEWIPEETPFGKEFGSNGNSATNNFYKTVVGAAEPGAIVATTTITFDSPVPADALGIFIGDLDIDSVTVSAKTADGTDLTGDELVGSSTSNGFNLCNVTANAPTICADVTDKTDVPVFTKNAMDVNFINSAVGEDIGVDGWIRPSAEITTLTVAHTGQGSNSSTRIVLAGPQVEALAETGSAPLGLLSFAALLTALGALTLVAARSKRFN